jgi:serine/threonine-protein kinase HipA
LARQEAVDRLHIIDGCQALGLSVGMKYERPYGDQPDVREIRDGASLRLLFEAINKYSVQPVVDRMALLRWAIFQVLIGNCDAHGKNVSFFVSPGGLVLAPTYDLVCIPALEDAKLDRTLAMAIGDAFTASEITLFDWAQLGRQAGMRMAAMAKQMQDLAKKTLYGLDAAIDEATQAGVPKEESGRVQAHVVAACQAVADAAKNVSKVDPKYL